MRSYVQRDISFQSGFTLIELMIVIAIIGILASIAIASYQVQVRKSHLTTIHQELNHFRLPYQTLMSEGAGVTEFNSSGLNMPAQTKYCQFSVAEPITVGVTIDAVRCDIQGLSYLQNQYISLDYDSKGSWQCRASADILAVYLPSACQ